jgi:hypothetical protein
MARTCIICGGPTGSREHIFPAALGGRRTNKGIYCADHNNEYADLAGIISGQLALFNAHIGVVGDHASETKPVTMTDVASGREIELTNSQIRFKGPQIISQETAGKTVVAEMSFNSTKEAEEWVLEQKAKGFDVQLAEEGEKTRYRVGTAHAQIRLGGDKEGLRAIGYIAQTFLAHSFPDIGRAPDLQGIQDYTLKNVGSGFVWWDFDPPDDLPTNKFPFGHRVIVGVNKDDGTAYARISFFSTLNFAVRFGPVPFEASRSVITDIDPLAKALPNDILSWTEDAAKGAVSKPNDLSASLAEAISSGKAQERINDLMRRIVDFEREAAAKEIIDRIVGAAMLSEADRDKLFADIVSSKTQRVFRLMRYVADDFRGRASTPVERTLSELLDKAVALDPASANGLTDEAGKSLAIACEALKKQMIEDFKAGILNQDRTEMLIGGGPGAYAVGNAIFQPIIMSFPDR